MTDWPRCRYPNCPAQGIWQHEQDGAYCGIHMRTHYDSGQNVWRGALGRSTYAARKVDNVQMGVELHTPVAIEEGLRFAIREGGRTVGAGAVTKIEE